MRITAEQVERYQKHGFLVLEDFVSTDACDELRARAEQLVREFNPAGVVSVFSTKEQNRLTDDYFLTSGDKVRFFFEEDAFLPNATLKAPKEQCINKIGHALHDLEPVFDRFSRGSHLANLIAHLGVKRPLLLQSMYIFKQPRIGGEVTCHQDCTFLYTEPIDVTGLWFALEDATLENGCLWAIPGGHKFGLRSRWIRTAEGGMRFEIFQTDPWTEESAIPLEVRKGAMIVLHGLSPHKSLANRSAKSRHAYILHVMGGDSYYPENNWLQRSPEFPLRGF